MVNEMTQGSYLGLDLGGTKLLIGETDEAGNILCYKKYPSGYLDQAHAIDFISNSLDDYLRTGRACTERPLLSMGLGVVGRVDNTTGTWFQIDRQRNQSFEVGNEFSSRYGMPCYVENDVRSATRAEMMFGHGKNSANFIYLNVGTGLAAGIVVNGKVVRGGHHNAGEVGHTFVGRHLDEPCVCGRVDCVENIVSGSGIDRYARILAKDYPDTSLIIPPEGIAVNVREVFEKSGTDALCKKLSETAAEFLARLIMNLVRNTDPDTVVLGGGVVSDGHLLPMIQEHLNPNTMRFVTGGVVLTKLNPEFIGLLGACTVAMNKV